MTILTSSRDEVAPPGRRIPISCRRNGRDRASRPFRNTAERAATDAFWLALRSKAFARGMRDLPDALDRTRDHGTDHDGTCRFTQTCGLPLFTTARGHSSVLGAPTCSAAGCRAATHLSYIVVRVDASIGDLEDLRGARFAINESDSNSGMNLPRRRCAFTKRTSRRHSRSRLARATRSFTARRPHRMRRLGVSDHRALCR